jgi:hypothetical protein
MAFATSQTTDTILTRSFNFRYTNNAPPSTFFTIYANGNGQTYWSNSITSDNLSSFSTTLQIVNSTLSTSINNLNSTIIENNNLLFSEISTIQSGNLSTTEQLIYNISELSNNLDSLNIQFINFTIATTQQFNNYDFIISTTVNDAIINATQYISAGGIFFTALSTVQSNLEIAISSLSTTISDTNVLLYSTITSDYENYVCSTLTSSVSSLLENIDNLSNNIVTANNYGMFSTFIINSLNSTNIALQNELSSFSSYIVSTMFQINNSSISSLLFIENLHDTRISSLELLSTNLENITYQLISSFVSTTIEINNSTLYSTINQNTIDISTFQDSISTLIETLSSFSSLQSIYNSTNTMNFDLLNSNLIEVSTQVYFITVSSILTGIWSSFYNLQLYTSTLIGERFDSISDYESNVYTSTVYQNNSISLSYFNYYVSSLYASTLSTLIPSTIAFTSTMVSTLYSTNYYYMFTNLSSLVSTTQWNFISTMYGLQSSYIVSTNSFLNSSMIAYLSGPASTVFANIQLQTSTTFGLLSTQTANQSTIFQSTNNFYNNEYTNLFISTINTNTIALSTLSTVDSITNGFYSTNTNVFNIQLSNQEAIFDATLANWNIELNSTAINAYSTIIISTINETSTSAGIVTSQTIDTYNAFISTLNLETASIGVSTLYTASTLMLTSNSMTQVMDLITYRNFTVFINNIADTGIYRLTYNSNDLLTQNYRRGVITMIISTVGQNYSTLNGALRFDGNTLGIPTTVWGAVLPYIGNADYTIQYEYTILNSILWTNLLGIYPRVAITNPSFINQSIQATINTSTFYDPSTILRGQSFVINWSNYSFFPYGQLGQPSYSPQVVIDTYYNSNIVKSYGPFPFSQSTATIQAPYVRGFVGPLLPTNISMYVLGYESQAINLPINVLMPTFDIVTYTSIISTIPGIANNATFLGGYELVAQTENNNFPWYNGTLNTINSFNNNSTFRVSNLVTNIMNTVGYLGSPRYNTNGLSTLFTTNTCNLIPNTITEQSSNVGYRNFLMNVNNYFSSILAYSSIGGIFNFTLNNGVTSTTISNARFSRFSTTSSFYIFNTSQLQSSNIFNSTNTNYLNVQFTINTLEYVSTQNPFVGPVGISTTASTLFAQQNAFVVLNNDVTIYKDAVSTVMFYNVISTPINSTFTANNRIALTVQVTPQRRYTYYISTTSRSAVQTFAF